MISINKVFNFFYHLIPTTAPQQSTPAVATALQNLASTAPETATPHHKIEVSSTDPALVLNDVFVRIMMEAGNLRALARVNKNWSSIVRNQAYVHLYNDFYDCPDFRPYLNKVEREKAGFQLSKKEIVFQTLRFFQELLQLLNPQAARLLDDQTFPINSNALENLEDAVHLNRFFDNLLKQIPPEQRPILPDGFIERTQVIRAWMNNPTNQAVLKNFAILNGEIELL